MAVHCFFAGHTSSIRGEIGQFARPVRILQCNVFILCPSPVWQEIVHFSSHLYEAGLKIALTVKVELFPIYFLQTFDRLLIFQIPEFPVLRFDPARIHAAVGLEIVFSAIDRAESRFHDALAGEVITILSDLHETCQITVCFLAEIILLIPECFPSPGRLALFVKKVLPCQSRCTALFQYTFTVEGILPPADLSLACHSTTI